ncbi:MAG: type IV toxin-antitoxin system AbiEi family antitoxin domain-containing protein [Elusimicrobiota bacterium]
MNKEQQIIDFLRSNGGIAGYRQISKAGFSTAQLKEHIDSGRIEKMDRGLYILSDGPTVENTDLVAVSIKAPKGVICLLSALAFHEITDEIPKQVDIAIPRGSHENKIKYPPVKFYHFSQKSWEKGIEKYDRAGHEVKIYSIAKTLADCFKFRSRIGINIVRDSMEIAVTEKDTDPKEIMRYSKICRVDKIVKPILEAII